MWFRRVLAYLRTQYLQNRRDALIVLGAALVVLGGLSFVLDIFLPWESLGMILRTVLLLPLGSTIFALGYFGGLAYHFWKARDDNWTPLRARFSPTWRQRISIMVAAILFVLVYATATQPGYTLASSAIAASVAGLFVFMRKSSAEMNREELGIPDARDAALNTHLRRTAGARRAGTPLAADDSKASRADAKAAAKVAKARAKLAEAEAELEQKG